MCCATGEPVSVRSRRAEGRLKEPGVFSLAKCRLSSHLACAEYTRGRDWWRWKELVKPREQCLHKSNQEHTGQKINTVCRGKGSFRGQRRRDVPEQPPKISCRDIGCLLPCGWTLIIRYSCKEKFSCWLESKIWHVLYYPAHLWVLCRFAGSSCIQRCRLSSLKTLKFRERSQVFGSCYFWWIC